MDNKNKQLIMSRFSRNMVTYNHEARVQKYVSVKLIQILLQYQKLHASKILEIGCGSGFLTKEILENSTFINQYYLNDIVIPVNSAVQELFNIYQKTNFIYLSGDAEIIRFPDKLDVIFSTSTFQWFQNLELFLIKSAALLNSKGILAFSSFGPDNFSEIRTCLNVGLKYYTKTELEQILAPHFNILHSEEWVQKEQFNSPIDVLKHIKETGTNGVEKVVLGKSKLLNFNKKYTELFENINGSVSLSYHPVIIVAIKK